LAVTPTPAGAAKNLACETENAPPGPIENGFSKLAASASDTPTPRNWKSEMLKAVASVNAMLFWNLFFICFIMFTFLPLVVIKRDALSMFFSAPRLYFVSVYFWKSSAKHLYYFSQ
jgi:hypothetical protein